jgi:hypothetical protein
LDDPRASLTAPEIAELLRPSKGPIVVGKDLVDATTSRLKHYTALGYRPATGNLDTSVVGFKLGGRKDFRFTLLKTKPGNQLAVFVMSQGSNDVDLHAFTHDGKLILEDIRVNPDPELAFTAKEGGDIHLVVTNPDTRPATCLMVLLLK